MCFYSVNYALYLVQQFHTDYAFQCAFSATSHFRNAHMPPTLPKNPPQTSRCARRGLSDGHQAAL